MLKNIEIDQFYILSGRASLHIKRSVGTSRLEKKKNLNGHPPRYAWTSNPKTQVKVT